MSNKYEYHDPRGCSASVKQIHGELRQALLNEGLSSPPLGCFAPVSLRHFFYPFIDGASAEDMAIPQKDSGPNGLSTTLYGLRHTLLLRCLYLKTLFTKDVKTF